MVEPANLHYRVEPGREPTPDAAVAAFIELEGSDFAYTKADSGDGWVDWDDQGRVAHGDPQTVKLDTTDLGA